MSSGNVIETSTHALVVFFSRAGENYCATGNQMIEVGHTLRVAQNVARLTQSPILELAPEHPYPADYQATVDIAKREWEKNERPALARSVVEKLKTMLSGVRVLYLGFPIWCGTFPRHVATFLDAARDMGALEGTLILPFSTQEGSGFGNSLGELARLAPQAIIAPGFTCQGIKAAESENGVRAWLSGPVVNRSIALAMEGDFQNTKNDAESAAKETPPCGCALLAQRTSLKPKYLTTPAPSMQTLEHIAQAAMRVPDHNHLVPYRYVVIDENAQYIQDLIGLEVMDADTGESYGTLTDVLQTGANDVYEIKDAVGKALYIPAIPDVVLKTDLQDGRMQIRPLEGLLDAN